MAEYLAGKNDRITFTPAGGEPLSLRASLNTSLVVRGGARIAVVEHFVSRDDPEPIRNLHVGRVGRLTIERGDGGPPFDIPHGAIVVDAGNSAATAVLRRVLVIVEVAPPEAR